jgi:membrane-associated phospholipid phosphatase
MTNFLSHLDISLLRAVHHHRIVALDQALYYLSLVSSYISICLVLSVLIAAIIKKSKSLRLIFYKMLTVLVIAALTSLLLKNVIIRERPFVTYPDIEKLSEAGSSSFPSGHTLEAFAIAVAFSIAFPRKKFIIPLFFWACLVAYSRMALGVHYPGDVAAGMVIGSLIGFFIPKLFSIKSNEQS